MTNNKSTLAGKMTQYRWVICAMLFFATTVNYLDRQVLSLTWDEFIKPEFHWIIAVSALNLGGIFSRNIWGVFRSSVSQKQAVLVTNMATGASLLISVVLAVMLPNLMLGVINIAYFWATQCFPMALATFFWRGRPGQQDICSC